LSTSNWPDPIVGIGADMDGTLAVGQGSGWVENRFAAISAWSGPAKVGLRAAKVTGATGKVRLSRYV
jgi:hypothetical protein